MATKNIIEIVTEICNQGCHIEVMDEYSLVVSYVPRCLISIKNRNHTIFTIKPLTLKEKSEKKYIEFNRWLWNQHYMWTFSFFENSAIFGWTCCDNKNDLDDAFKFVATHMYHGNINRMHTNNIYPNIIDDCKKILRNEMVRNLSELYLMKFMDLANKIPVEVKIIIVEMLLKLDKWNNLELY